MTFPKNDLGTRVDVRTIEGREFHRSLLAWSVPASLRTWKELRHYGFAPKDEQTEHYGEYLTQLTKGNHRLKGGYKYYYAQQELFPYQNAGVEFLRPLDSALLFDEPGVGKTLQAAVWMDEWEAQSSSYMIVAPKATLGQWADLLSEGGHNVIVRPSGELVEGRTYILNPEHLPKVSSVPPNTTAVIDEAHLFKNPKTKRFKQLVEKLAIAKTPVKTPRILALTGTPMNNRPKDLWGLYLLLGKRHAKQFFGFALTYCAAERTEFGWNFDGASNLDKLREDMLHWSLRRELREVRPDMPDVTYLPMRVHIEGEQMDSLEELDSTVLGLVGRGLNVQNIGEYQELAIAAAHAKVPAVIEWIENHLEEDGSPVVVGCGYKDPLYDVVNHFSGGFYTGDQNDKQKAEAKDAFLRGDIRVLGVTYGAGGTGLDGLQYASHTLVELDIPWLPSEVDQIVGRLYRQGQEHPLTVVQPITNTRVERAKAWAQRSKRSVIECFEKGETYGLDFY